MHKKALLCTFLFAAALPSFAQVKPKAIEFVAMEAVGGHALYNYSPEDTSIPTDLPFKGNMLTLEVPPSPKSGAVFFDVEVLYRYTWSGDPYRSANCGVTVELWNPLVIPEGIMVSGGNQTFRVSEENNPLNKTIENYGYTGGSRYSMAMMKRDANPPGQIHLQYANGVPVPDAVAIPIINALIDTGFEVSFYPVGFVQGISKIDLYYLNVRITRLAKD